MSRFRLLSCAVLVSAGIACNREPTAPPGNLTGVWGGEGIEFVATRSEVQIRLTCAAAEFAAPLRIGANGSFALPGTQDRTFRGEYFGAFGAVTSEQLEVTLVRWSAFDVRSETFVARLGTPANLEGVCILTG